MCLFLVIFLNSSSFNRFSYLMRSFSSTDSLAFCLTLSRISIRFLSSCSCRWRSYYACICSKSLSSDLSLSLFFSTSCWCLNRCSSRFIRKAFFICRYCASSFSLTFSSNSSWWRMTAPHSLNTFFLLSIGRWRRFKGSVMLPVCWAFYEILTVLLLLRFSVR